MRRPFLVSAILLVVLSLSITAIGLTPARARRADDPAPIDRVEEDWQLVINAPDTVGAGPQITTSMSAGGGSSAPFVAFNLNYRDHPSFAAGGMQVQVCSGNQILSTATHGDAQCDTTGETITWTQRMSLVQGATDYSIQNGQSTTWGSFSDDLAVSYAPGVDSLDGYDPAFSVEKSGAGWESDHVQSMTLLRIRYYANGDLVATDNTPRSIPLGNGNP